MKIKSPIGFLALWSAFLAAGTWILPLGALAIGGYVQRTGGTLGEPRNFEADPT